MPTLNLSDIENRIVGGNLTSIDKFPYQISLRLNGRHICGGSILTEKHVLTAGHCVRSNPWRNGWIVLQVLAGSTNNTGEGENQQLRKVVRVVTHPRFGVGIYQNDISILFVDEKFVYNAFIQPIKLPQQGEVIEAGSAVTIAGWGLFDAGLPRELLRYANLSIIADEVCQKVYSNNYWTPGMLCSGPQRGRQCYTQLCYCIYLLSSLLSAICLVEPANIR